MPEPRILIQHYDPERSYRWNYDNAPELVDVDVPPVPGKWTFCGRPVASPLGIAAGPLLNGRWILYYAALGFDVLTYKTVRSATRECYPLPNLQPVRSGTLQGSERGLPAISAMEGSWAISFGMPSMSPDVWRRDVEWTREHLPSEKLLSVSVVGTDRPGWTLDDLADDYARCARWAVESGADAVETNFSCPNVATCDGQLYQDAASSAVVAARVREAIGRTPYLIKIGHVSHAEAAAELLQAVGRYADGLAMTNCIAATVQGSDGALLFGGQKRGIGGEAIRESSIAQVRTFADEVAADRQSVRLIGVGGISSAEHVREYRQAGAETVQLATAAMIDPGVALRIRSEMAKT